MFEKSFAAFVVTKPIQYLNAKNIEKRGDECELLIVDAFCDAKIFFSRVVDYDKEWNVVLLFTSVAEAFQYIVEKKCLQTVYLDSDIGNRKYFRRLRRRYIVLYEEGVGSYRSQQYFPRRRILGELYLKYLNSGGHRNRRGGNRYTNSLILYFPKVYNYINRDNSKPICAFSEPLIDFLRRHKSLFQQIFQYKPDSCLIDARVCLVLSSWTDSQKLYASIHAQDYDYVVVKPHPHLKNSTMVAGNEAIVVDGFCPAECIIESLLFSVAHLTVVSYYSSSTLPFIGRSGIEVVNVEQSQQSTSGYEAWLNYLEAYRALHKVMENTKDELS